MKWKVRYGWLNIAVTVFLVVVAGYILFTLPSTLETECCKAYNENKKNCVVQDLYTKLADAKTRGEVIMLDPTFDSSNLTFEYDELMTGRR